MDREEEKAKARKRRNATWRKYRRALRVVRSWGWDSTPEEEERRARHMRDDMAKCSCSMCGNPRRNEWSPKDRITLQERRALLDDPWDEAQGYLEGDEG